MSFSDKVTTAINALTPYQAGMTSAQAMRLHGLTEIFKLSSNEAPMMPSVKVREAINQAASDTQLYPDYFAFTQLLAQRNGVDHHQVIIGNGSIDVLEIALRLFSTGNSNLVCSQYGYSAYPLLAGATNLQCKVVPSTPDFGHDPIALAQACDVNTAALVIDNPTNLAGQTLNHQQLNALMQAVPDSVLVILDEAYVEFTADLATDQAERSGLALVNDYPNLLITRTFSKAYGLAGLRVGYGIANPLLIDLMNRIQRPFPIAGLAIDAATAALGDQAHFELIQSTVNAGKRLLYREFDRLSLEYYKSDGNFVLIKSPLIVQPGEKNLAVLLLEAGFIVRPMNAYKRSDLVRISIMDETTMTALVSALEKILSH